MLFLIGLEVYEVLSHYTLKPRIIFGFAIADFIVILLTWKLAPWATVKGELLSGTISGQSAALQGPHCITTVSYTHLRGLLHKHLHAGAVLKD